MKNTLKKFVNEAKVFGRVYFVTFQAVAILVLVYVVASYITGKQIVLVEKGDAVLKTGVVEVHATK